jgi:hypothetical protein
MASISTGICLELLMVGVSQFAGHSVCHMSFVDVGVKSGDRRSKFTASPPH